MYSCIVTHLLSGLNLQSPDDCRLRSLGNQRHYAMCPAGQFGVDFLDLKLNCPAGHNLLIRLTKSTYYKTPSPKNSILNFTHELNKNNKNSFLDALIDTDNHKFTTSTYKKTSSNNSCTLNFKSECPFRYKKAIINNLISRAKLISIFHKEVENKTGSRQ